MADQPELFDRGIDTANPVIHEERYDGDPTHLFGEEISKFVKSAPGDPPAKAPDIPKVTLTRCLECQGMWMGGIPGHHGAVMRQAPCGHWRKFNCKNRPVGDCEECLTEAGHA